MTRRWVGPFKVRAMLEACVDGSLPRPPEAGSAYFISAKPWKNKPTSECQPLYVGGNTGKSSRFRTRIGDLQRIHSASLVAALATALVVARFIAGAKRREPIHSISISLGYMNVSVIAV